jgi:hypothetical protein
LQVPGIKIELPLKGSPAQGQNLVAHTGFAIELQATDFSFEPLKTGFLPKPHFVRKIITTENP